MARWLLEIAGDPNMTHLLETVPDEAGVEPDLREEFEVLQYYYGAWYRRWTTWWKPPIWSPVPGFEVPLAAVVSIQRAVGF